MFEFCKDHLCANDTVLYSCAPTAELAFSNVQADFYTLQYALSDMKLNSHKTKVMIFATGRTKVPPLSITTLYGVCIQSVDNYKYLGIRFYKKAVISLFSLHQH